MDDLVDLIPVCELLFLPAAITGVGKEVKVATIVVHKAFSGAYGPGETIVVEDEDVCCDEHTDIGMYVDGYTLIARGEHPDQGPYVDVADPEGVKVRFYQPYLLVDVERRRLQERFPVDRTS